MRYQVIRDSDGFRLARFLHLLHLCPGGLQLSIGRREPRAVDEVQVYIVELQSFQGGIDGAGDILDAIDDFGSDEKFFSRHVRLLDRDAELGFSVVELSTI